MEGGVDELAERLVDTGTIFCGVSVTDVALDGFGSLSAASGGRFEIVSSAAEIIDRVTGIARALSAQYLLTYPSATTTAPTPELRVNRPGTTARVSRLP